MTYIKRLKLKGFKSFANPTTIEFEEGFNSIVGANGSGKSNVFDAMCFVLGRMSSKGLRAEKLGNLVFNGGKNLKPAKEAEVSIFLSNENKEFLDVDLDEIKITRIISKSGQSKYLLNNNKVTRTEILEILKRAHIDPDGYNIILQGDITKIVNMSNVERRELIEDISDISGYEEKREKSLKKLEKVNEDLNDADLLMEEKTKYLKELKSEKELAVSYEKVKESLNYNQILLLKAKLKKNIKSIEKKKEDIVKYENKINEFNEKSNKVLEEIKNYQDEIKKLEKSIEVESHKNFIEVTNKITQKEEKLKVMKENLSQLNKDLKELKTRIENIKLNISTNKKEVKKLENERKDLEKILSKKEKDLKEVLSNLENLKSKYDLSKGFSDFEKIDSEIDELNLKKQNKLMLIQDNKVQIEKLNVKIESLEEQIKKIESVGIENKDKLKELDLKRKELKKLIVEISKTANQDSEISAKINNLNKEYSSLMEEIGKLRYKVENTKHAISQNRAIETILQFKNKDSSIFGTVASLSKVPSKYLTALENLAGKSLLNIVVKDEQTAVKYINYLKEKKIGVVTFLPLNKIRHSNYVYDNSILNKKGVIDYAINLIDFDKQFEPVFKLLFGDSIVIEKIEDAKGIGIGSYKMVTLDGDIVAKTGAMSGGFRSKKSLGLLNDNDLVEKLEKLESKSYSLKETIDLLNSQKKDLEKKLYDLRTRKIEIEGDISKLEKLLSIDNLDTDSIKTEIEYILADKKVLEKSLEKQNKELEEIDKKLNELAKTKEELKKRSFKDNSMNEISNLEQKKDNIKQEIMDIKSEIDKINIQIKNVYEPESKNLNKILEDNLKSIESLKEKIKSLKENINETELELKELKIKEKELSKDYKSFIEERDKIKEKLVNLEKKNSKILSEAETIKERAAKIKFEFDQLNMMRDQLLKDLEFSLEQVKLDFSHKFKVNVEEVENLEEYKQLIDKINSRLESEIDLKELQSRVNNLKTKLNSFGSINMKAVEIYDKLNEEFQKLLEKREVLTKEKEEILNFISELDEKKKEKFMETFTQLRKYFSEIYSKLSSKGQAELNLENEKDIFNSGVEIKVKLSRNNYLDIKSLSGGEKTITAIAFIFAIQEFNPASFYIFDEVDAALDIVNAEKLGKLIKQYSENAQYIVVSHSEYLIQSADTIYGVTMDKNKISGIVSLDLSDMKDYLDEEETVKT